MTNTDTDTTDAATAHTLDDLQEWRPCTDDTPGPRQVSAARKALGTLRFAGRGEKTLTGTIGGIVWEAHTMGCLTTGERAQCTIDAEHSIGVSCAWTITKKNAAKIRKRIEAATVAADATIPIIDERITPEAAEERDAKRLADCQALSAANEDTQSKAEAERATDCAPILAKKPPGSTAVIVAQFDASDSDMMTDYHAHHSTRTVVIGYRSGTRENFRALRLAAGTFEPTSHLGPDASSEVEHRDNHSMGGGNFLKDGYQHDSGWRVFSRNLTSEGGIPALYGDTIEDGIPEAPATAASVAPVAPVATGGHVRFEIIATENKRGPFHLVVPKERADRTTFEAQRDKARESGGWYSRKWGKTPGGFGFDNLDVAERFAASVFGDDAPPPTPPTRQRDDEAQRLEFLADKMQGGIDHKRGALTQNSTPRRERIKSGQRADADRLEMVQRGLRAIAGAMRANTLPPILAGLTSRVKVAEALGVLSAAGTRDTLRALIKDGETDDDRAAVVEREEADKLRELEAEARASNVPGFFPTPAPVVERMLDAAGVDYTAQEVQAKRYNFLEPSAGMGSIAEPLRDYVQLHGGGLVCVEQSPQLCEILRAKGLGSDPGCTVVCVDFLESDEMERQGIRAQFDRILMNPPFEKGADVVHVRRALGNLAAGGILVALMTPRGAETMAEEAYGNIDVEQLPPGSFTGVDAFRQTGVSVAMVTIILE